MLAPSTIVPTALYQPICPGWITLTRLLILWEPTPANDPPANAFYWQVYMAELVIIAIYFVDVFLNWWVAHCASVTDRPLLLGASS